jgi:hypothetical protein
MKITSTHLNFFLSFAFILHKFEYKSDYYVNLDIVKLKSQRFTLKNESN